MQTDDLNRALAGTRFADVRWVAETGSTNADLLALARAGEPEGVVLVADHQTAGRGRLGRTWEAPPGSSLLLSVLTRPASSGEEPVGLDGLHLVSMAMGVAAAEAVSTVTGAEVGLKWPNDLVAERAEGTRKLSGILAESVIEGDQVLALVVGIGINVNWPDDVPAELADIAVAANHLTGAPVDRAALLEELLRRFDHWYDQVLALGGRALLHDRYRALSATLGRSVRVELRDETVVGVAVALTADGHLVVEPADHPGDPAHRREITVGDVVHLRPHT